MTEPFTAHARLDQDNFYACIAEAGFEHLEDHPYAPGLFAFFCEPRWNVAKGVPKVNLDACMQDLTLARSAFDSFGRPIDQVTYPDFMQSLMCAFLPQKEAVVAGEVFREKASVSFQRWDIDSDGLLSDKECDVLYIMLKYISQVFNELAITTADGGRYLDHHALTVAMQAMGLPDITTFFSGTFKDWVFLQMDSNGSGTISFIEYMRGSMRLVRPIRAIGRLKSIPNYPGWQCFDQLEELARRINSLDTGDVICMSFDDTLARLIRFTFESPWSHAAVVIRRGSLVLDGVANLKTEELLEAYPSSRKVHRFCSPGYCRCFFWREGEFPLSTIQGTSDVLLLEASGEGIHIYDLAHRLFEMQHFARRHNAIGVRRLRDAPNRHDKARIAEFLRSVRGSLYLKGPERFEDLRHRSFHCAPLVAEFYEHMGWARFDEVSRAGQTVWPGHFAGCLEKVASKGVTKIGGVKLLPGQGSFDDLELIWAPPELTDHFKPIEPQKRAKL